MAATVNKQFTRVDYSQLKDTLTTNTPVNDAFGSAGRVYMLFVKSGASVSPNYIKLYDTQEEVTGTTLPSYIFPITGNSSEMFHFPNGIVFSSGVGYVASNAGGTGLGANPAAQLDIQMVFK